jgi:glycine cleavage system H protein
MPDPLTFYMGKHAAVLPQDVRYCKNHMYVRPAEAGPHRFGFGAYAVRLMQDVYFLEWKFDAPTDVRLKQEIGFIESSKAQSELYAPAAGTITAFNAAVLNDPSVISAEPYGDGWLFEQSSELNDTMTAAEYQQHLVGVWEQTQRLLKKQIHLED